MKYKQGLHILAEFETREINNLSDFTGFKILIDKLIAENSLQKTGEVYHSFENAGYTAVICLTESHISIHTWPEFGMATFDIFLSNFMKNNDDKGRLILEQTLAFFNCHQHNTREIRR